MSTKDESPKVESVVTEVKTSGEDQAADISSSSAKETTAAAAAAVVTLPETKKPSGSEHRVGFHHHVVPTDKSGALSVYVQGDIEDAHKDKDSKCVFMTCHDIGNNHSSFSKFVDSSEFEEIKKRAIFIHVDIPGQEEDAEDLPDGSFPTIQSLGEDLVTVLDQLRIKYCIGIGDGAGANIITRFGMMHVTRCLGVILLHPTANSSTMMENFKDRIRTWKLNQIKPSGENIVAFRKFGHKMEDKEDKEKALEEYKQKMKQRRINPKNLKMYTDAFMARTDIVSQLKEHLKCDALVVVGTKSSHVHSAEYMHSHMEKTKSSLLKVDNVGNVLEESPTKLANAILLFCKGLGWLTSVNLPGIERRTSTDSQGKPRRQRSISMEDYDKPNIRRLSVSSKE